MKVTCINRIVLMLSLLVSVTGCLKQPETKQMTIIGVTANQEKIKIDGADKQKKKNKKKNVKKDVSGIDTLDFEVENLTGKTIYVTCFSYLRRRIHDRWHWSKSPIYELTSQSKVVVAVAQTVYEDDYNSVFGFLGVFDTKKKAEDSIYELMQDEEKIDLDLLFKLKGKKVTINIENYGFKKPFYDYDFVTKDKKERTDIPELDFYVLNDTGKTIFVCGFTYMKKAKGSWVAALDKDDMAVWRFDKTKVLKLAPHDYGYIDVDTIASKYDRDFATGFVAVFDEHEEKLANEATFELVDSRRKLDIGNLKNFKNGLVVIDVQKYGIKEDLVEYTVKPVRKIDMTKIIK